MPKPIFKVGDVLHAHGQLMIVYEIDAVSFTAIELTSSKTLQFPTFDARHHTPFSVVDDASWRRDCLRRIGDGEFFSRLDVETATAARKFLDAQLARAEAALQKATIDVVLF